MAEIIKDPSGWTKDEKGDIRDPEGNKWYAHQQSVGGSANEGVIEDEFGGKERVVRIFLLKLDRTSLKTNEEIYHHHKSFFEASLKKNGLKPDYDHPVKYQRGADGTLNVIIVCKPGSTNYLYSGMKHGDVGRTRFGNVIINAKKTDSINKTLQEEQASKDNKK